MSAQDRSAAITRDELPQCVGMIFDAAGNAIEAFDWTPEALEDAARRLRGMLGESTTVTYGPSPFMTETRVAENPQAAIASQCAKCGGIDVFKRWHPGKGRYGEGGCGYWAQVIGYTEHLHCTCRTCQFEWLEDTLDNLG